MSSFSSPWYNLPKLTFPFPPAHDEQLFVIPFAKSAVTAVHTPVRSLPPLLRLDSLYLILIAQQDNTKHAFLQMDDRVLVYRGADQPDMSVINPESDVWQHIKVSNSLRSSPPSG